MSDENPDQEDKLSIPLPFEDALRGLLAVDPESIDPEAKDAALKRLQNAPIEEMDVFGHALREDALQAGATEQEIRDAEALPPLPSS